MKNFLTKFSKKKISSYHVVKTKKSITINIEMLFDDEKMKKYNAILKHKQKLTITTTHKIVQLTFIEKKLNYTTIKLSKNRFFKIFHKKM